MQVEIKLLNENAKIPQKMSTGAAGYDIFAADDFFIGPNARTLVKSGISVAIPLGFYGRIAPKSGLAFKSGLDVLAGVIDSDYSGEIGVILYNTSQELYIGKRGDKIAQLIIENCHNVEFKEVPNLAKTDRGDGGFGSTGR